MDAEGAYGARAYRATHSSMLLHACGMITCGESLAPGQPMECPSENVAIRRVEALSRVTGNIGAVAFKRTGYPSTGDFKPAEIIKTFGEVPDDLSEL